MRQTRRMFLKQSGLAMMAVGAVPGILRGATDKIRVGFIGVGNRGSQLLQSFMKNDDCEVAALCDVYRPFLDRDRAAVDPRIVQSIGARVPKLEEKIPAGCKRFEDFRELLAMDEIDAVCIATPDHWHAVQTIAACRAGKDVYVEKPLTITLEEGRRMIKVAHETERVVTVGINRRAAPVYRHLIETGVENLIGEVSLGIAARVSNMFPDGIGRYEPTDPPAGLNWDLWLGPRAERPFRFNILPYKFRWWKDFSSQMANWGVHYIDGVRWMLGESAPVAVTAVGSRNIIHDDADIPDTMEVLFEFPSGRIMKFSVNEACDGQIVPNNADFELRGTKGNLVVSDRGYQLVPPRPGQFQSWKTSTAAKEVTLGDVIGQEGARQDPTDPLVRNFLDCVKSRETPYCSLEDGHRSTSFALLANIAVERGKRLEWDAESEQITNDPVANAMQHYDYRSPWSFE